MIKKLKRKKNKEKGEKEEKNKQKKKENINNNDKLLNNAYMQYMHQTAKRSCLNFLVANMKTLIGCDTPI